VVSPENRVFQRNFEGALHAEVDEFASLHDHLVTRTDPGNAPAAGGAMVVHPGGGVAGQAGIAMQAKSALAFEARKRKSFGLIRQHVEDETIRDDIDANAPGDGPAAWLIVIAAGTAQQTALFDDTQDIEWNSATVFLVGISETTIRDFKGLLLRLKVDLGYQTPAQGAEDVWRADGSGRKNQPSHVWRLPCARPWRSQRAHQRVLSTSRSRTSAWLDMEPRRSFRRHPTAENSLPGDFLTSRSMRGR